MVKLGKKQSEFLTLYGVFKQTKMLDEKKVPEQILKEQNKITVFPKENVAYIFLGDEDESYSEQVIRNTVSEIIKINKTGLNINVKSFIAMNIAEETIVKIFTEDILFYTSKMWNLKTGDNTPKKIADFILTDAVYFKSKELFKKSVIISEAQNWTRNLQIMSPNKCTAPFLAKEYQKEFRTYKNVFVSVLSMPDIKKMKMGLIQAVNMGSREDAKVVILEYVGDNSSKEKTVLVGKGITFDSGGMNLKPGRYMTGMKYDMSGSAVVVGVMKAIAQLKPKSNISVVVPLTDNSISETAGTPDSVWLSMNGKSVEVNNTDAEGRLILADAITYSVRNLKATKIIDVATLTGSIVSTLGHTFTGVWATEDSDWENIKKIAKQQNENVWRMPFHEDFSKYIKGSKVADLKNTDLTGNGGAISAAMFLKEFTEGVPYIHMDIAGTSNKKDIPLGPMIKTLVNLFD